MSRKILLKETLRGAAKEALKQGIAGSVLGGTLAGSYNLGKHHKHDEINRKFKTMTRNGGGEGWNGIDIDRQNMHKIESAINGGPSEQLNKLEANTKGAITGGIIGALHGAVAGGRKSYKDTKKKLSDERNMQVKVDDGKDIQ